MDQLKGTHRIFAYGTLKRGQPNHHYLSKCTYVGTAVTDQTYPLIVATHWNLPFLLDAPGEGKKVIGELYDIDDDLLAWMDDFEGHPSVYTRDLVKVNRIIPEQTLPALHQIYSSTSNISSTDIRDYSGHKRCDSSGIMVGSDVNVDRNVNQCLDGGVTRNVTLCSGIAIGADINECVNGARQMNIDETKSRESDISSNRQLCANVPVNCSSRVERNQDDKVTVSAESSEEAAAVVSEQVWVYLLRKFPPRLLTKESYACYDSNASHQRSYHPE